MSTTISKGTRVAYSRTFLNSTAQHAGWAPFARGRVVKIDGHRRGGLRLATVLWDDKRTTYVNVLNLVREDRLHLEPA